MVVAAFWGLDSVGAGAYEDMLHAIQWTMKRLLPTVPRGMDANTVSPQGETLLMLAAREGKPGVVKTLFAAGPNSSPATRWVNPH